jgi:hypothetical protein
MYVTACVGTQEAQRLQVGPLVHRFYYSQPHARGDGGGQADFLRMSSHEQSWEANERVHDHHYFFSFPSLLYDAAAHLPGAIQWRHVTISLLLFIDVVSTLDVGAGRN